MNDFCINLEQSQTMKITQKKNKKNKQKKQFTVG